MHDASILRVLYYNHSVRRWRNSLFLCAYFLNRKQKIHKVVHYVCAALIVLGCLSVSPARADTKKDLETLSKAISFMKGGPLGVVDMAIVYDSADPDSVAHAEEIFKLSQQSVGTKVSLKGVKVPLYALDTQKSRVVFLTRGTQEIYEKALENAAKNQGITISTDEACLGTGCVLMVKTSPSIQIFVNTAAANAAGVEFASAFSMMITRK